MKVPLQEKFVFLFSGWFQSLSRGFWKFHETSQLLFHSSHFISHEKEGYIFVEAKDYILAINFGSSMAKNKKKCPLSEAKDGTVPGPRGKRGKFSTIEKFSFFPPLTFPRRVPSHLTSHAWWRKTNCFRKSPRKNSYVGKQQTLRLHFVSWIMFLLHTIISYWTNTHRLNYHSNRSPLPCQWSLHKGWVI